MNLLTIILLTIGLMYVLPVFLARTLNRYAYHRIEREIVFPEGWLTPGFNWFVCLMYMCIILNYWYKRFPARFHIVKMFSKWFYGDRWDKYEPKRSERV